MNKAFGAVFQAAKNFWHSLPHQVQAAVVVFTAAGSASLGKILSDPSTACWQSGCVKHYLGAAVGAGLIALRAFYMRPGPGPHAGETTYSGS